MQANAVVLAVRNRKAVILANGGIYEEIPNQGYHAGEKIVWKCKKTASAALRRGLMIAACLVLLLTSSVAAGTKYLPWTYVSVALGETTVQYCLNARNEVLSAQADTEEGQTVLEKVAVSPYESIEETMTRTLKAMRQDQTEDAPVHVEIASRFGDGQRAEDAVAEAGKAAEMEMTLEQVPWQDRGRPMDHPPEESLEHRPQPTDQQEQPMQEKHEELPPAGAADIPGADRMEQRPPDEDTKTDFQGFFTENASAFPPDDPGAHSEVPGEQPDYPMIPDTIREPQNEGTVLVPPQESPPDPLDEPLASDHSPESSVPETAPKNDSMPLQGFAADLPPMQDQTLPGDQPDVSLSADSIQELDEYGAAPNLFQNDPPFMPNEMQKSGNSPEASSLDVASKNEMKPLQEAGGEAQPSQQIEARLDAIIYHAQQADTAPSVQSSSEGNKQNNPDPMSRNTLNERKTEACPPIHQ